MLTKFHGDYIVPENLTRISPDHNGARNPNEPGAAFLAYFGVEAPYRVISGRAAEFLALVDGSPGVELVELGSDLVNLAKVGHISRVRNNAPNKPPNYEIPRVHFATGGTFDIEHSEAVFLAKLDALVEAQSEDDPADDLTDFEILSPPQPPAVEALNVPARTKGGPR